MADHAFGFLLVKYSQEDWQRLVVPVAWTGLLRKRTKQAAQ